MGETPAIDVEHSHAREEDIPGTVNLRARGEASQQHALLLPKHLIAYQTECEIINANHSCTEGDDTGYGQALFPVPAEDPNDPLQVSTRRKERVL